MDSRKIKQILKERRIYQWEVAKEIGITEFTLTRWLREDMPDDKQEKVINAIETIMKRSRDTEQGGRYYGQN